MSRKHSTEPFHECSTPQQGSIRQVTMPVSSPSLASYRCLGGERLGEKIDSYDTSGLFHYPKSSLGHVLRNETNPINLNRDDIVRLAPLLAYISTQNLPCDLQYVYFHIGNLKREGGNTPTREITMDKKWIIFSIPHLSGATEPIWVSMQCFLSSSSMI